MNITYEQIIEFNQYYDPIDIGMPKNYSAKISEFIIEYRHKFKDKSNILRTLLRKDFLSGKELRLYAVWCARQVQHLMKDQRSIDALDVAERYTHGQATEEELRVARAAASAASAAYDAAYDAAYWDAAYWDAAYDATRDKQIDKLLEIFEGLE